VAFYNRSLNFQYYHYDRKFTVLLVLYGRFLAPVLPQQVAVWGLPVVFIGSIVIGFVVYRIVLKAIMKRVNMEDTFDPLFKPRRSAKKD